MTTLGVLRTLDGRQWRAFLAAYLGWMLDAFDYFLLVMVVKYIAVDFHAEIADVSYALVLTLAMRPLGALIFGFAADRWGRRPALMASILFYATMELSSAFAPSLAWLLASRALFGIGMGGEWGVGASLAMESAPAPARGILSGILQQGYPVGYILAALAAKTILPHFGWRGMFVAGFLPAVLVLLIRAGVHESPAWLAQRDRPSPARTGLRSSGIATAARNHWPLFLYLIALMTAFNFFSHGTQDLYPSAFLDGGIFFGALSQRIGRRRAIVLAALLALPAIPFWIGAYGGASVYVLAAGAFFLQFAVQGAWGVVPAHLNELAPAAVRGILPGLAYQLGNLFASKNSVLQAGLAVRHGGDYGFSLGWVVAAVAIVLAALAWFGPEKKDEAMGG
jgi:SHS family lactate transporter-like MFS transporter